MVTDFSLSVNTYVGAPPSSRNVVSRAANTVGMVRSRNAITIRNRDHANQAQNSTVLAPSMTGPSPKSYCNHNPGSVTHGRWIRAFPSRYCFLTCGDGPPGRPLRPGEPHRHQLVVRDVGADLAVGLLDPFLDLGQELINQPRPAHPRRDPAGVPLGDQPGDRVMRTPRQVGGGTQRTGQIERLQNLHRFLGRLQVVPPGGSSGASAPPSGLQEGPQPRDAAGTENGRVGSTTHDQWAVSWPSVGRNRGHQRAVSWPPMGSFSWPRTRQHFSPPPLLHFVCSGYVSTSCKPTFADVESAQVAPAIRSADERGG